MIAGNGALADLISSGARIMESACGFCIGAGQSPVTDGISLRTNNRNFKGRSGTDSGQVYLVSPETAALSALKGELVNPLDYSVSDYPEIILPDKFTIDDSMIIPPATKDINIVRGPNIGDPPYTDPLMNEFRGIVGIKTGDKITTDHIMPAGDRLKFRSNIPKYSEFVFENIDRKFSKISLDNRKNNIFTAIVGGESYGQGSSREHAAICPMYLGVRLVLAKSFERIHSSNLINFGILPLLFTDSGDYDEIKQFDEFVVEHLENQINISYIIKIKIAGKEKNFLLTVSKRQKEILLAGGLLNYTKNKIKVN
jgi:aconitate hydratase